MSCLSKAGPIDNGSQKVSKMSSRKSGIDINGGRQFPIGPLIYMFLKCAIHNYFFYSFRMCLKGIR